MKNWDLQTHCVFVPRDEQARLRTLPESGVCIPFANLVTADRRDLVSRRKCGRFFLALVLAIIADAITPNLH